VVLNLDLLSRSQACFAWAPRCSRCRSLLLATSTSR
jgi:hypothetical protein